MSHKALFLAVSMLALAPAPAALAAEDFQTHFMSNWDADSDGKVTLQEAQERREAIFAAFDADEDGFLTAPELATMDEMRANEHASMANPPAGRDGSPEETVQNRPGCPLDQGQLMSPLDLALDLSFAKHH